MSSAKHTPGPWKWRSGYNGMDGVGEEIFTHDRNDGMWLAYGSNQEANARLIAAAPELLAALERCDLAFADWQVGVVPGRPEDILALIAQVRAALAKATGEAAR